MAVKLEDPSQQICQLLFKGASENVLMSEIQSILKTLSPEDKVTVLSQGYGNFFIHCFFQRTDAATAKLALEGLTGDQKFALFDKVDHGGMHHNALYNIVDYKKKMDPELFALAMEGLTGTQKVTLLSHRLGYEGELSTFEKIQEQQPQLTEIALSGLMRNERLEAQQNAEGKVVKNKVKWDGVQKKDGTLEVEYHDYEAHGKRTFTRKHADGKIVETIREKDAKAVHEHTQPAPIDRAWERKVIDRKLSDKMTQLGS